MTTKMISLDNGHSYMTAADAAPEISNCDLWDTIVNMMDDDTREIVHAEFAPCTNLEFLIRYLELAPSDLVIG